MTTRQAIDPRAMGLMLALSLIWGLQQVALKATAGDVAPLLLIAVRSGMAALMVYALMRWRGEPLALRDGTWRPGMLVGALFALEYLLVAEGLRQTSAAHIVVFLYTAPIFAAIGLHRKLPAERLRRLQWAGIGLAFAGIALAFFGRAQAGASMVGNMLWGDFLGLLAGAAWGATTVVVRTSSLNNTAATKTLLYQLVGAFVLLLSAAALSGQTGFRATPMLWANLLFQVLVVSFASFLVWFWLLRHYLASQLGVFSFMTPLFGVAFGVWLLNEPLEPAFLAGALLVLAGIVMVSGHGWLRARFA
ncbi:DMT family transporter [Janthinobacterium sp.]|uniref:DMT family transporter n=1 Tax=Janthinobacterium sp. TaxID=1871054 RepID=UPI00293D9E57|nr:DMT family transporter [Janthinobacterium sp.]